MCQVNKKVGSRVRAVRKFRGMTMVQLAGKIGISQPYLSSLERGDRRWNITQIDAVALALRVDRSLLCSEQFPVEALEAVSSLLEDLSFLSKPSLDAVCSTAKALRQAAQ